MVNIYELMEIARKELLKCLPADYYTDDWQWSNSSFQFVIVNLTGQITDPYRFCYDADEEWAGTPEEQLREWINWWFY